MDEEDSRSISNNDQSDEELITTNDWKYNMRREMQEIIPNLFLGPWACAQSSQLDKLQNLGITHIVCVRHTSEAHFIRPRFPQQFQYWELEMQVEDVLVPLFDQFCDYINNALNSGGRILVHGNTGMCTSAALVIALIMRNMQQNVVAATKFVQQRRFCIFPSEPLQKQLKEYQAILEARNLSTSDSVNGGSLKRSYSQCSL